MATVVDVMNKAARECSVTAPSSWIAATTTTYLELKDFLADTVDELLDRVDWPEPITQDTIITGTGVESYALPSDFKRLTRDDFAVYETTTSRRAGIPITSNGDWTFLQDVGSAGGNRYYRITGNEEDGYDIGFYQFPATGDSITVAYVTYNWLSSGGTPGRVWSDPTATLLLPRRLVEMGIVWRFRRRKGLPYQDRLNEYEGNLIRLANDARGVRKIAFGESSNPDAKPMRVPVPDFIPSS